MIANSDEIHFSRFPACRLFGKHSGLIASLEKGSPSVNNYLLSVYQAALSQPGDSILPLLLERICFGVFFPRKIIGES